MIFEKIEISSNHGTEQGILPRFELQMIDLYRIALTNSKEYEFNKFVNYTKLVVPEITHLYDIHLALFEKLGLYKHGMINGEFAKIQGGIPYFDRSIELEIDDLIKDFFISGRILLENFRKSQIIDDTYFCLDKLLLVNDKNFQKNKIDQKAIIPDTRYDPLYDLIEISRQRFLNDFNDLRVGFEHNQAMIDKFDFDFTEKKVKEPIINGMILSQAIDFYYENILEMIEKLMCYFYGINAHLRSNGDLKLFIVNDFDYKNLKYKYTISIARFNNLIDCDYK